MGFSDARFDVNLSILFTELPLLERPAAAAAAGFTAVELWWPWPEAPVPEPRQLDALRAALQAAGTRLVGLNFYAGQLPGPDRGALSLPGEESARFRANVEVAADFAQSLGCTALNALYGNRLDGADPDAQDALALENLALAARAAHRIGATLLIEALNAPESPRCPITSAPKAIEVVEAVNAATGLDNARFLMDLYHLARNGEDLEQVIDRYTPLTGHVQIADSPGRGAPGTGTLPLEALLERLHHNGYRGWTGLEYQPGERPGAKAFGWLPRPLRAAAPTTPATP
ncbi:hydroxypyruvate isomerase [Streptomyces albofaciens JCM 4342]|uniref:TIM barrel protein n=1 Tax=Streptomyces albofaciens TaxID=66866 RepID=UPI001238D93E|nr:TIM barrel protein [Streptomyces albofaciens]KAA6213197.1 hydroxypyruvate isomerase [Streptomyces albofaciens JCM 4342]